VKEFNIVEKIVLRSPLTKKTFENDRKKKKEEEEEEIEIEKN
jgi:hypothetical protein